MFKKPLWQTIGAVCSGSTLFASIHDLSVMLGNYLQQKTSADDIFAHHYRNTKLTFRRVFSKFSSDKMTKCNNDQTWFSDTLTSARPLRVVKTLAFEAWV